MRVAVIGGSGFLGQHVVDALVEEGHHVRILDVVPPRSLAPGVEYVYEDLEDVNSIRQNIDEGHVVIHLAAVSNTRRAWEDPEKTMFVNSVGTQNVFEAVRQTKQDREVTRVVLAGSSLVSGALVHHPKAGTIDGQPIVNEFDPFDVRLVNHPYVMSKIHLEMIARVYAEQYGVHSTVLRYGIQYGRNMAPGVVAHSFITNALAGFPLRINGDGSQWRQYTHVKDIAAAHVKVVQADPPSLDSIGVFNVVGDEIVTIKRMAEVVSDLTGAKIEYGPARDDDIAVKYCSNKAARSALGWVPSISLEEGFKDTVEWYQKNPTVWAGPEKAASVGR